MSPRAVAACARRRSRLGALAATALLTRCGASQTTDRAANAPSRARRCAGAHGTPATASIGRAASLGCLRAHDRDVRALIRVLPLGAPVFVRD